MNRRADPKTLFAEKHVKYDAKTGKPYVERPTKKVDGSVVMRRRYGELVDCLKCGFTFLKVNKRADGYCSRSCARKGRPTIRTISVTARKELADRLFSIAVRERGACERCGASYYPDLQCAHIVSRKYLGTRWDWDNAFCLCKGCHYWGHAWPLEWEEFVDEKLGAGTYADLKRRAREWTKSGRKVEWEILIERLEVLVEAMTGLERPEAFVEYTYRQRDRMAAERE